MSAATIFVWARGGVAPAGVERDKRFAGMQGRSGGLRIVGVCVKVGDLGQVGDAVTQLMALGIRLPERLLARVATMRHVPGRRSWRNGNELDPTAVGLGR